ncbi:hypothetical protein Fifi067_00008 [Erwinia phage Fifi067]|nr:hypothetical protein Fifi067_00008 [Erwinia phage Fifi067]WBQ32539.1 putative tail-length tape measure protein [Erwinia phage Kuerle]
MSNESVDVQLARIDERMKTIILGLEQDRISRKEQYETTEQIRLTIQDIQNRVGAVEKGLADSAPTIEEFITIKHKVAGAGVAGRWLWVAAAAILGFLFTMRREIIEWLAK